MESIYPIIVVALLALNSQCTGKVIKSDSSESLSFLEENLQFANGGCPAWLPAYDESKPIPGLKCQSNDALLMTGYCATYQQTLNITVVGMCPFN